MKTLFLYLYHLVAAGHYNRLAARHAVEMRHGATADIRREASQRLLDDGAASNRHERERDRHEDKIRRRPWRYGPQAAIVIVAILALLVAVI